MVTPQVSLLFPAFNRLAYTQQSWAALMANTDWSQVAEFHVYDDGSTDGTLEWLTNEVSGVARYPRFGSGGPWCWHTTSFHSPMGVTLDWIERSRAPILAKLDNDTIYPPGWLGIALDVMERHPELDCLGLECMREPAWLQTPESHAEDMRCLGTEGATPEALKEQGMEEWADALIWPPGLTHRWGPPPKTPWVEGDKLHWNPVKHMFGYIEAIYVSGLGLYRRSAFRDKLPKDGGYFGFEEFMQKNCKSGWILPSLPTILLDRLPMDPWKSLSEEYVRKGWQRPWSGAGPLRYKPEQSAIWQWWTPST